MISSRVIKLNNCILKADKSALFSNFRGFSTEKDSSSSGGLAKRFVVTAEVAISKIFPAGFGWQYGSVVAADYGYAAADLGFAAFTGIGDCIGVAVGHTIYYTLKRIITGNSKIDLTTEAHIGIYLGSAAFFSGFAWQPIVNALQSTNTPFLNVALGTWGVCGLAFFTGLRLFRIIYSPVMRIEANNSKNLVNDATLSLSIGGASGAFVGTDIVYQNGVGNEILGPLVGVLPTDSVLIGCTKAGSATAIGFTGAQIFQNVTWPSNKNWID